MRFVSVQLPQKQHSEVDWQHQSLRVTLQQSSAERLLLPALSGTHTTYKDVSEAARGPALVRFILISADEPCWPWPGNRQASSTAQHKNPPPNVRRADRRARSRPPPLPPCVSRRAARRQEAVAHSLRPLKPRQFKCLLSFGYRRVTCVSSIFCTVLEVRP